MCSIQLLYFRENCRTKTIPSGMNLQCQYFIPMLSDSSIFTLGENIPGLLNCSLLIKKNINIQKCQVGVRGKKTFKNAPGFFTLL